jgi:hypothetical protein
MLPVVGIVVFLCAFILGYIFFGGVDFSRPEKYSFVYEYQSLIAGGLALMAAFLAFFVPLIVREIRKADFLSVFRHECFIYYISIGTRSNHFERRSACGVVDFQSLDEINIDFIKVVETTYLTKSERLTFSLMKEAALRAEKVIGRWRDKVIEGQMEDAKLLLICEDVLREFLFSAKHAVSLCERKRRGLASSYPLINRVEILVQEGRRLPVFRAKQTAIK